MKIPEFVRDALQELARVAVPRGAPRGAEGGDPDHDGGLISRAVMEIVYAHEDDPDDVARVHEFDNEGEGTLMFALPGGWGILIFRADGSPVAADFVS